MNQTHNMHHQRSIHTSHFVVLPPHADRPFQTYVSIGGSESYRCQRLYRCVLLSISLVPFPRQDETKFIHSLITRSCEALRVASTFVKAVLVYAVLAYTGRQALSQWVEG